MSGLWSTHLQQPFSRREIEILNLMKEGLSNHAIAQRLSISTETVKWYNQRIFGKLEVSSRIQAIDKAMDIGLIEARVATIPMMASHRPTAYPGHNLPAPLTAFIGRKKELAELRVLLHGSTTRLVTILGAGGIGKTCLALHMAREIVPDFPQGVWLVDFSVLKEPGSVTLVVANTLGVVESGATSLEEQLVSYLRSRKSLLVLDNCEHLAESCARLVELLLKEGPNLRILATSREALEVEGEVLFPPSSLAFPNAHRLPELDVLRRYEAVQLFVERAGRVCPGFTLTAQNSPAVARVCQSLDGIPLALELAAARSNLLAVEQIAARLEDSFQLLAPGGRMAIPHHQTMQACIDWSYDFLSEPERVLLRQLAVFAGGWTLETAEQVCKASVQAKLQGFFAAEPFHPDGLRKDAILELMGRLVNHSMVEMISEAQPVQQARYRLLVPIRQYALEKLEQAGEVELLRDMHLACFVNLAEKTAQKPFQKVWPNQGRWLKKELNNLRSALDWALADPDNPRVVDGLRLAAALKNFWFSTGMHFEGSGWISKALGLCDKRGLEDKALRALALEVYGETVGLQNQKQRAELLLDESVALFREVGDDWMLARALYDLALWPLLMLPPASARRMTAIEESTILARQVGDPLLLGTALFWKALLEKTNGDDEGASQDAQESLGLLLEIGARGGACYPLVELGAWAIQRGDLAMALRYREDFLRYRQEVEDVNLDWLAGDFLLTVSYHTGDFTQMVEIAEKVLDASLGQNMKATIESRCYLGFAYKCQGDYHRAAACFNQGILQAQEEKYEWGFYYALAGLAALAARRQQMVRAVRLIGLVEKIWKGSYIAPFVFATEMAMLHKALSPEQFSQAWAEGQAMGAEEAFKEGCAIAAELA